MRIKAGYPRSRSLSIAWAGGRDALGQSKKQP